MKTRLLFTALAMTVGSLSAQTFYQITNITGSGNKDTVWAQGPNQLVPPLVISGTCVVTLWSVDIYSGQYSTANPASQMPGFLIGNGGVCQMPANITRRTFGITNSSTVNGVEVPVPGIGSEMSAKWLYTFLPARLLPSACTISTT